MLPHPTFFVKKWVYDKYGYFNTDFKISADYELMLRFLVRHRISTYYIPEVLIKMRIGGVSNRGLKNLLIKSYEDYKAWRINNLNGGFSTILLKNLVKIPQFIKRI
jgi:glycosyltransferase